MAKDMEDKERIKAERLRDALRANLRRRKGKPETGDAGKALSIPGVNGPDTTP